MELLVVVMVIFIVKEAFQEYGAEKYAQKKRHKDVDFFDFMLSNHPLILLGGIAFIVLLIFGLFAV